jgi:hypothetical protein
MLQLGGEVDLAMKPISTDAVSDLRGEHLDHDLSVERPIGSQKYLGHAPAYELSLDDVGLR